MSDSDKKIIGQVIKGDVSAYALLVNKYQSMAFTLALSITKNREDAEEVAQDAFVKAYNNLNTFKGKSKFSTWLYQIIYRTALSKIRINKPIHNSISEKEDKNPNLAYDSSEPMERSDRKTILKKAINYLSEDEGFLIILYYYQEQTIEEIAETTQLTVSNVKVKLFRARKNLHDVLQRLMNGQAISLIQNQ